MLTAFFQIPTLQNETSELAVNQSSLTSRQHEIPDSHIDPRLLGAQVNRITAPAVTTSTGHDHQATAMEYRLNTPPRTPNNNSPPLQQPGAIFHQGVNTTAPQATSEHMPMPHHSPESAAWPTPSPTPTPTPSELPLPNALSQTLPSNTLQVPSFSDRFGSPYIFPSLNEMTPPSGNVDSASASNAVPERRKRKPVRTADDRAAAEAASYSVQGKRSRIPRKSFEG